MVRYAFVRSRVAGYVSNNGARPIKWLIQKDLETALGRLILEGEIEDGDIVTVNSERKAAGLKFSVQPHSEQKNSIADIREKAAAV